MNQFASPFALEYKSQVYFEGCAFTLVMGGEEGWAGGGGVTAPTAYSCYRASFRLKMETDYVSCRDTFNVFIIALMKCTPHPLALRQTASLLEIANNMTRLRTTREGVTGGRDRTASIKDCAEHYTQKSNFEWIFAIVFEKF